MSVYATMNTGSLGFFISICAFFIECERKELNAEVSKGQRFRWDSHIAIANEKYTLAHSTLYIKLFLVQQQDVDDDPVRSKNVKENEVHIHLFRFLMNFQLCKTFKAYTVFENTPHFLIIFIQL